MTTYRSILRIRFATGLQYRAAAVGGLTTQFFWGALQVLVFTALFRSGGSDQPMTLAQTTSYVWLQQAFLALLMPWFFDAEIFQAIEQGNLAYELCRPTDLYTMWSARAAAGRLSAALLRCFPILLVAACLPAPYGLMLPRGTSILLFLPALALAFGVVVTVDMLIYVLTCYTMSPRGVRMIAAGLFGFLAGEIVPIAFLPAGLRTVLSFLPFGAMQNVPLRIYSGNMQGQEAVIAIALQFFWLGVLFLLGRLLLRNITGKVQLQGG